MMKGPTIRLVNIRVCYVRDLLHRGTLYGVWQNPRSQTFFCYTGKLAIARFHNIWIPL